MGRQVRSGPNQVAVPLIKKHLATPKSCGDITVVQWGVASLLPVPCEVGIRQSTGMRVQCRGRSKIVPLEHCDWRPL